MDEDHDVVCNKNKPSDDDDILNNECDFYCPSEEEDGMDVGIATDCSACDNDNPVVSKTVEAQHLDGVTTHTNTIANDTAPSGSRDNLTGLPIGVVREIASFLPVNDMFAMTVTCKAMYHQKLQYQPLKASTFCLIKEERLSTHIDFRSTLEPFKFLFQSDLYGMIQVDFSIVNPPPTPAQQIHRQPSRYQQPRYQGNPVLRHYFGPPSEETHKLEDIQVRINVQKKFPPDEADALVGRVYSPKVIFRLDQSLPGCSFHFESKYVCREWRAGHLSYLVHVCATRLSRALEADTTEYPPPDKILRKFAADMRDNLLRCIRNGAKEAAKNESAKNQQRIE